jgi:hypothetical protein
MSPRKRICRRMNPQRPKLEALAHHGLAAARRVGYISLASIYKIQVRDYHVQHVRFSK